MNSVFLLRALAAWKMLRQQKIRCCHAAGKPAIGAECSEDQRLNSQSADKAPFRCGCTNGGFQKIALNARAKNGRNWPDSARQSLVESNGLSVTAALSDEKDE